MFEIDCPHCKEKIVVDGQFCKFCGGDLENEILALKQQHLPVKYQIEPEGKEETKKKEQRKMILIVTTWVVSAIATLVMIYLITGLDYYEIWAYIVTGIFGITALIAGYYFRRFYVDQRKTWFKFLQCLGLCDCF